MPDQRTTSDDRGATSVVGIILLVAITVVLASAIGVSIYGVVEDVRVLQDGQERPTFAALELEFEQADAAKPDYDQFRWQIDLSHTGGEPVDASDIVVQLDHGDQRVTGTLDRTLRAGETVSLVLVHNNQNNNTIPPGLNCSDVNVACRLAGDDGNYPEDDRIRLRMIHEPTQSILYEEEIRIAGQYGIYNGNAGGVEITDETLTFA